MASKAERQMTCHRGASRADLGRDGLASPGLSSSAPQALEAGGWGLPEATASGQGATAVLTHGGA